MGAYHTSNMLRPILPRARFCLNSFRRSLVTVPEINPNFNNGVPGLLSPAGFDIAWTQYQGLMVEKLNNLIAGGDYESKPPKIFSLNTLATQTPLPSSTTHQWHSTTTFSSRPYHPSQQPCQKPFKPT